MRTVISYLITLGFYFCIYSYSSSSYSPPLDDLKEICTEYFDRMYLCEGQKWDLEFEVAKREYEVLPACEVNYTQSHSLYYYFHIHNHKDRNYIHT